MAMPGLASFLAFVSRPDSQPQISSGPRWERVGKQRGLLSTAPIPPLPFPCPYSIVCCCLHPARASGLGLCVQLLPTPNLVLTPAALWNHLVGALVQGPKPKPFDPQSLTVLNNGVDFFPKLPADSSVTLSWNESHWPTETIANMYLLCGVWGTFLGFLMWCD